jgi:enoyl-CoA hydratase/carnithine racemase
VSYQHILYEVNEKIATVTLHRPDRMNAWTPIMERDVRHAMEAAAADDDVRVIVLTGSGRAFCAGADMESLKGLDPGDIKRAESVPPFDMNRRPDWQTRYAYYPSIPKPVIGMLNGATAGIGLVHALYCDLRFAADNTVFTTAFSRRDGGGAARQRFSRRRGEFYGEAAAKIYGEVNEVPELQRENLRLPRPVVALRAMPGTLRLWLSWLRHA